MELLSYKGRCIEFKRNLITFISPITISNEYLLIAVVVATEIREATKEAVKIAKPSLGFLVSGYNIMGENQKSCMSTAKYQRCPRH